MGHVKKSMYIVGPAPDSRDLLAAVKCIVKKSDGAAGAIAELAHLARCEQESPEASEVTDAIQKMGACPVIVEQLVEQIEDPCSELSLSLLTLARCITDRDVLVPLIDTSALLLAVNAVIVKIRAQEEDYTDACFGATKILYNIIRTLDDQEYETQLSCFETLVEAHLVKNLSVTLLQCDPDGVCTILAGNTLAELAECDLFIDFRARIFSAEEDINAFVCFFNEVLAPLMMEDETLRADLIQLESICAWIRTLQM